MKPTNNSDKDRLQSDIHREIWNIIRRRENLLFRRNLVLTFSSLACVTVLIWNLFIVDAEEKISWKDNPKVYFAETHNVLMLLPDSSQLLLKQGSRVLIEDQFSAGGNRSLRLEGRAFLDVKKDPLRPFTVHVNDVDVRVLGTSFDINSHSAHETSVTVFEGSVQITHKKKDLDLLAPMEQLRFDSKLKKFSTEVVSDLSFMDWQFEEDLFFDDVSVFDASVVISRKFGYEFQFQSDRVKEARFTTIFKAQDSIEHILESISAFTNSSYHIDSLNNLIVLLH